MILKKITKKQIISLIILVAIFMIYFINANHKVYGNDRKSIIQVIKSIEGYENESIEILEIKDIDDERVVAFLSNNSPAYIQFSKEKGNYVWKHIEKSASESFSTYLIHIAKNLDKNPLSFMIVTNQNNQIAKMQLSVNDQVIEKEFSVNQNSVSWIQLPESNGEGYKFTYKYFDKEGNLVANE